MLWVKRFCRSCGRSSSGKSIAASAWARAAIRRTPQASVRRDRAPSIWRSAWRRWASVSAAIRSTRPSTSLRSSLPLSKARRVNSPASAGRRPGSAASASSAAAITARPPCRCSSAMSSPVKLRGPGSHSTRPRSMAAPERGSLSRAKAARRSGGRGPASASSAAPASGPETRTTATPARPGALESAKIVSPGVMARQPPRARRVSCPA